MRLDESLDLVTQRVRDALVDRGVSGAELARRVGVQQRYMARRLAGKVPWRVGELERVAKALGVPLSRFITADQEAA